VVGQDLPRDADRIGHLRRIVGPVAQHQQDLRAGRIRQRTAEPGERVAVLFLAASV
jgi:hypothetical protein